jgi:hypothetical protein
MSAPNVVELEAAIAEHARKAVRYGPYWRDYEWTHEQINVLLDEREKALQDDRSRIARRVRELFG